MSETAIKLLGLIGFIILCFLCIFMHADEIEADLTARSAQALSSAGISLDKVSFSGQDGLLEGEVESQAVGNRAAEIVGNVYGVRVVNNHLRVAPLEQAGEASSQEETETAESAAEDNAAKPAESAASEGDRETVRKSLRTNLDALLDREVVHFVTDSDVLSDKGEKILDEVTSILKKHPNFEIEIQGHTDTRGDAAYNLDLSQRRADAVKRYLVAAGINSDHLTSVGYGETQPIADESTSEGLYENRRIEFRIKEEN